MENESESKLVPTVGDALHALGEMNDCAVLEGAINERGRIDPERASEVGDGLIVFAVNEVHDMVWDDGVTLATPLTVEMLENGIEALDKAIDDLVRGQEALRALIPKVPA